jgi:hypothetical protein
VWVVKRASKSGGRGGFDVILIISHSEMSGERGGN